MCICSCVFREGAVLSRGLGSLTRGTRHGHRLRASWTDRHRLSSCAWGNGRGIDSWPHPHGQEYFGAFSFLFWRCLPCGFYMLLSFLSQIHPTASENSCQQQRCLLAQDLGPGYREKGTSHAPAARGGAGPPPSAHLLQPHCPPKLASRPRVSPQDAPRFCLQTLDSVSAQPAHVLLPQLPRWCGDPVRVALPSPPPVTESRRV